MPVKREANRFTIRILTLSCLMIVAGAALSLSLKYQDQDKHKHPFFMVQQVFFGELIALLWFVIPFFRSKKKLLCAMNQTKIEVESGRSPSPLSRFWVGIGGVFDAISSSFQIIGLLFLPTNLYLLIKNGTIIFCVLFSLLMLGTRLNRQQWLSLLTILAALVLVAVSKIFSASSDSPKWDHLFDTQTLFGLAVMVISVAISGFQIAYQEFLFRNYSLDPRELTGLEGLFGTIVMTFVLLATSMIECDSPLICGVGHPIDSAGEAMVGMWRDPKLFLAGYISVLSALIFNVSGSSLVKINSAIFRMIIDSYRTVLTWLWLLFAHWGDTKASAVILQFAGTILLMIGNVMYIRGTQQEGLLGVSMDSYQMLTTQ